MTLKLVGDDTTTDDELPELALDAIYEFVSQSPEIADMKTKLDHIFVITDKQLAYLERMATAHGLPDASKALIPK